MSVSVRRKERERGEEVGEKERIREGEGEKETERDGNSVELYSASNNIGTSGKEPACQCRRLKKRKFDPWLRKTPWRRAWQPTPVFLTEESRGPRSLAGYSP